MNAVRRRVPSADEGSATPNPLTTPTRVDRDEVFLESTKSICPVCKVVVDAEINVRDNKVFMRKRCPEHGKFEALIYGDAEMYAASMRFNKPGTLPLQTQTEVHDGCPLDCGLPGPQATCLRRADRGQHGLQPRLPGVLRRLRPPPRRLLAGA
jgi:hypothetical protein